MPPQKFWMRLPMPCSSARKTGTMSAGWRPGVDPALTPATDKPLTAAFRGPGEGGQRFDVDNTQLALLQQLVDAMANPSYIADPFWTVVAMNPAAADTFDTRVGESCLHRFFTDPELARPPHVHKEMMARSMVAQFRAQSAKFPDDPPRFDTMARSLCEVSKAFNELWQRQVVSDSYHVDVVYDHPTLGRLSFAPHGSGRAAVSRSPPLYLPAQKRDRDAGGTVGGAWPEGCCLVRVRGSSSVRRPRCSAHPPR